MSDVDILLVEDNSGDVHLIERAFETRELPGVLHPVQTGEEALDWLYQRGDFAEAPRPDLVLLDLNLSATSGQDILEEIKSEPQLKRIPVIILTSSQSEEDLIEVYEKYANAYLPKPVDPVEFSDLIQTFAEFWMNAVTLPPTADDSNESV